MRAVLGALALTGLLAVSARAAEFISAGAQQINVRSEPSLRAKVLWQAWRYTPFEILEWGEEWAMLRDFEGDEGWVHQSVLSSQATVIVAGKRANVREGPALEFDVLWSVEREYPLKVLGYEGDWVQVSDGVDVHGWINKRLLWGSKEPWQAGGNEV